MRHAVGSLAELWRYPVKGMCGESLPLAHIGEQGLNGDRGWALRDSTRGEIQSCKSRPQLLTCVARCRSGAAATVDDNVQITLPDGRTLGSDDPSIHEQLTALTGHVSSLERLRPAADRDFFRRFMPDAEGWKRELEATFAREPGEPLPDFSQVPPEAFHYVSSPGTFFLVTPIHILTRATLLSLQQMNPSSDWAASRFRPNLLIDAPGSSDAFPERSWLGRRLALGDAVLECVMATPRCGAITRAQPGLNADARMLRTVVNHADQNVGIYGVVIQPGRVRAGDAVHLID